MVADKEVTATDIVENTKSALSNLGQGQSALMTIED